MVFANKFEQDLRGLGAGLCSSRIQSNLHTLIAEIPRTRLRNIAQLFGLKEAHILHLLPGFLYIHDEGFSTHNKNTF